ncbi:hypothetical protein CCB80_07885 [Armatimonadetes bacterium Uphvl-Ar1]|nr:hypothetical protein CCB80_07885 [Armatimonadetes bacterium Uphvl-Ar1]
MEVLNTQTVTPVESPCVRVCRLDGNDVCVGCCRTIQEIISWPNLSDTQKARIIEKVEARKTQAAR